MARHNAITEDLDLDEVDAFDANSEKVLLEEAGDYGRRRNDSTDESDEEVLGLDDGVSSEEENDVEDDEDDENDEENESDAAAEGWGSKKNYYGGDEVSDDDDDGAQMAEEALRQQKKHLEDLEMDDYVDEATVDEWTKSAAVFDADSVVTEEKTGALASLDADDRAKLLKARFPEFVPLVKEFGALSPRLPELQAKKGPLAEVKAVALTAYLGLISSYFAIFVDNLEDELFASMKDSPVMESILGAREVWRQASELPESDASGLADVVSDAEVDEEEEHMVDSETGGLSDVLEAEMAALSDEESISGGSEDFEDAHDVPNDVSIDVNAKRNIKKVADKKYGDFTETATPDDVDFEDKQRRKRTLRFYTSKIDQAVAKNNDRYSGDADLPYKERLFERQQRLTEEARKRGLGQGRDGADLDGADAGSDDERVAGDVKAAADDTYYKTIKQQKDGKKQARRDAHDQAVQAARDGRLAQLQENVGEDGKRALNFQILKNKGLTPHRSNENRNARVKKRKKYEKAQKKLKSVRQVYEGAKGPYEGEKTGIKKGITRSVKLV